MQNLALLAGGGEYSVNAGWEQKNNMAGSSVVLLAKYVG